MIAKIITVPINKSSMSSEERKEFIDLKCIPDAFVLQITVENISKVTDHYEFVLRIHGRSRFCNYLSGLSSFLSYTSRVSYNLLKKAHKELLETFKHQVKVDKNLFQMPMFPEEVWFTSKKEAAENRIAQFNEYFVKLFCVYGQMVIFSETLINICRPFPVDILVLSNTKDERNLYLNIAITTLFEDINATRKSVVISSLTDESSRENTVSDSIIKNTENYDLKTNLRKALWKKQVPLDYVFNDRLFRIDFANRHQATKTLLKEFLWHAMHVFIVIDLQIAGSQDYFYKAIDVIARYNKTAARHVTSITAIIINPEITKEQVNIHEHAVKTLGKKVIFIYAECNTITRYGVLEPFNYVLNLYK